MSVHRSKSRLKDHRESTLFITDLPNNVIDNILMHLPLKDAGRTSVLSTSWRYIWSRLPQLLFDHEYSPGLVQYNYGVARDKLMKSVYEVLILHAGPILKFKLSVYGLKTCPDINSVLHFVFRNGVEDLALEFANDGIHNLPSWFFSYHQLKHLRLFFCELRPPTQFQGFSKLVSLQLLGVTVAAGAMQTLISLCPLLEMLKLLHCPGSHCLEINAPNLCFIILRGSFETLSLRNVPKLVGATFELVLDQNTYIDEFFSSLGSVENLDMSSLLPYSVSGDGFLRPLLLCSLKDLRLTIVNLINDISSAFWLVRNSPSIKMLTMEWSCPDLLDDGPVLNPQTKQDCSNLNHLHEVKMIGVLGMKVELELIDFLLAKSPKLRKLVIGPQGNLSVRAQLVLLTKITEFGRASPMAEIMFLPIGDSLYS